MVLHEHACTLANVEAAGVSLCRPRILCCIKYIQDVDAKSTRQCCIERKH